MGTSSLEDKSRALKEIVKCVVVGDTAVGKTRLICASTSDRKMNMNNLLATHVPTVFSVDQYRSEKDVLKRSFKYVDGVHVSLRLWDTFGDHHSDRTYSFENASVVLLCFSIASRRSLKNCRTMWVPEIRRYCPHVPIVLVGCKSDQRHMCHDKSFIQICYEKSPYKRVIQEKDLTTTEEGRKFAEEIEASYYETSALQHHGITEVFTNAIRAALIHRKQTHYWSNHLSKVRSPAPQQPRRPPRPSLPELDPVASVFDDNMESLFDNSIHTDVNIHAGGCIFKVHAFILSVVSPYFEQQMVFKDGQDEIEMRDFEWMSPLSMATFLRFVYTGIVKKDPPLNYEQLIDCSRKARVRELKACVMNIRNDEAHLNIPIGKKYLERMRSRLRSKCYGEELRTDVTFKLDDGEVCKAHRSFLIARSDFMAAMFSGNFKESLSNEVTFPGVSKSTFHQLMIYIYSDSIDKNVGWKNFMPLLELANRFCLLHMISLIENIVVKQMLSIERYDLNVSKFSCSILEFCQMHNAVQLAEFCQYYICINYNKLMLYEPSSLRKLNPYNQAMLNKRRWPPQSFYKEMTYYSRRCHERDLKECLRNFGKKKKDSKIGCLSFLKKFSH